jgi:NADP-dependent 3-hydroxy acid dehydrogenase YdfG
MTSRLEGKVAIITGASSGLEPVCNNAAAPGHESMLRRRRAVALAVGAHGHPAQLHRARH